MLLVMYTVEFYIVYTWMDVCLFNLDLKKKSRAAGAGRRQHRVTLAAGALVWKVYSGVQPETTLVL